jgi:hypothetical protein
MQDFVQSFRMDKTAVSVLSHEEAAEDDRRFWLSKTPAERLEALELLRQIHYGYDPATLRLQRVLTVVELDDLKANKKAMGRPKDQDDLEHLSSGQQKF